MILILSEDKDSTADAVMGQLRRRGHSYLRFNPARFPREASASLHYDEDGRMCGVLNAAGERYRLENVTAIYYRRPEAPACPKEVIGDSARSYVEYDCGKFLEDVWNTLDCRWMPAPAAVLRRIHKAGQIEMAHAVGFELPPTLITNDPAEFLDFYREHNGRIISKVFSSGFLKPELPDEVLAWTYAEVVSSRSTGYAASIRHSPVIFQAYVPKRSELRITVVGHKVFAAEIFSQSNNRSRRDWRRYDLEHTPHRIHRLPEEMESRCVALVERLGLSYGAIDLILTPDGRYVFLEINPNGQWQWIASLTGLPIAEAVCEYLAGDVPAMPLDRRNEIWKNTAIAQACLSR